MFIIRAPIYFLLSFLVLSLPIGKGTLFDTLYDGAAPIFSPAYNSVAKAIKQAGDLVIESVQDIFQTTPKKQVDVIKARMSSTAKTNRGNKVEKEVEQVIKNLKKDAPAEEYTQEERDLLRKIIRETQY